MKTEINFPITLEPLFTKSGLKTDRMAVLRPDISTVIGVVGQDYRVIPHVDLFNAVQANAKEAKLSNPTYSTSRNGAVAFVRYQTDYIKPVQLKIGDIVKFEFEVFNSLDGSLNAGYRFVGRRLVCTNGMTIPKSVAHFKMRHTSGASIDRITCNLKSKLPQIEKATTLWKEWTKLPLLESSRKRYSEKYLNKRTSEKILDVYESKYKRQLGKTVWSYFNALTDYSTHILSTREEKQDLLPLKRFYFERNIVEPFYGFRWN